MAKKKEYREYITPDIKELIPKWKRQGQNDMWIYKNIGISHSIGCIWKREYPEFAKLFDLGIARLVLELEETLYTRALGTHIVDEEYLADTDGKPIPGSVKVKRKYIWSDKCLEMALKKLAPDKWGETNQASGDRVIIVDDLSKLRLAMDKGPVKAKDDYNHGTTINMDMGVSDDEPESE